jgi:hypothetical protein
MTAESQLKTYEHAGHMIYVHTYQAITACWALHVTVVGDGADGKTEARHVAWDTEISCATSSEAMATGEELARAFLDGMLAAA